MLMSESIYKEKGWLIQTIYQTKKDTALMVPTSMMLPHNKCAKNIINDKRKNNK